MEKYNKNQMLKHTLIIIGALAAFYFLIGISFKNWSQYQFIGTGMVALIIIISAARMIMITKKTHTGEINMSKRRQPKKEEAELPEIDRPESFDFGFPIGKQGIAVSKAGEDLVSGIKKQVDDLTDFVKMGTTELNKQYQQISKLEQDINKKAKELHEQWIRLKQVKQMVEDMLRIQTARQEAGPEYGG